MRFYTVHRRIGEAEPVLVPDGFAWAGFLFTLLWALWHRLWAVAAGILVLDLLAAAAVARFDLHGAAGPILSLALSLLVGLLGNDLRRWTLARRGYAETDVVSGAGHDAALLRYWTVGAPGATESGR